MKTRGRALSFVIFLIILIVAMIAGSNVRAQATLTSVQDGKWEDKFTWDCVCNPSSADAIVINHKVTIDAITNSVNGGPVKINAVTIQNTGIDAVLIATGQVSIGAGGLIINATSLDGGAQLLCTGGDVSVKGNASLIRKRMQPDALQLKIMSDGTVSINGDLSIDYNDQVITGEAYIEINLGSGGPTDKSSLAVDGNLNMTYNSKSSESLTFEIDNKGSAVINGNLTVTSLEGGNGNGGKVNVFVRGASTLTVNGQTTYNYSDPTPHVNHQVNLFLYNSANVVLKTLNFNSSYSTGTLNNWIRLFNTSSLSVGDVNFAAILGSVENRIEVNENAVLDLGGEINNTSQGSFDFPDPSAAGNINTSTIKFTASVNQPIPKTKVSTVFFQNIVINNTSGSPLALDAPITMHRNLTLLSGIISSTSGRTFTFDNNATSDVGNANSYISGQVKKKGTSSLVLPIGASGKWAPLELQVTGGDATTLFTTEYFKAPYSNLVVDATLDHVSGKEYWNLKVAGTAPTSTTVSVYWEDACFSKINDASGGASQDLFVGRFDSNTNKWTKLSSSVPSGQSCIAGGANETGKIGSPVASPYFANEYFTFAAKTASVNPLPIHLISFKSFQDGRNVNLSWRTGSEVNTNYYTIEHSNDGKHFVQLTRVPSNGNIYSVQDYSYVHKFPLSGLNYYRLVEIDLDGLLTYLDIVVQKMDNVSERKTIEIFPNPVKVTEQLAIALLHPVSDLTTITFVDMNGGHFEFPVKSENEFTMFTLFIGPEMHTGIYSIHFDGELKNQFAKIFIEN